MVNAQRRFSFAPLITLLLCSACTDSPIEHKAAQSKCPNGCACTTRDPCLRTGVYRGCNDSFDCPSGTECGTAPDVLAACELEPAKPESPPTPCLEGEGGTAGSGQLSTTAATGVGGHGGTGGDGGAACADVLAPPASKDRLCTLSGNLELDTHALINGFGVVPFDLSKDEDSGRISWSAPEETEMVICAVFRCVPVLADADPATTSGPRFSNFEQCELASERFPGATGDVSPKEMSPSGVASTQTCDAQGKLDCPGVLSRCASTDTKTEPVAWGDFVSTCPITTRLLLGCWSTDTYHINGASPLMPLSANDTANYCGYIAPNIVQCGPDDYGRACVLPTAEASPERFGICWEDGECRTTCVSDADCQGVASDAAGAASCITEATTTAPEQGGVLLGFCRAGSP